MRELLLILLKDQKRLTGIRQYEEIASNPNGKEAAQFELDALLEPMIEVCNEYPEFTNDEKFAILKRYMTLSKEYYGLNARFIRLSLEAEIKEKKRLRDIYWKAPAYVETNKLIQEMSKPESNAVPFEKLPKEIQDEFNKTLAKLASGTIQKVDKVSDHDLKVIQTEDEERVKKEAKSQGYDWQAANEKYLAVKARLKAAIESRGLDKLTNMSGLNGFYFAKKNITVWARSIEEAQEIYLEVYI